MTTKVFPEQIVLDTDGNLAANSDLRIPSQKAVKSYTDDKTSGLAAADHTHYRLVTRGGSPYIMALDADENGNLDSDGNIRTAGGIFAGYKYMNVPSGVIASINDMRCGGGLSVGSHTLDVATGQIIATGEGYLNGDKAGAMNRLTDHHRSITDHFRSGSRPSGFYWNLLGEGTEPSTLNYSWNGDYLLASNTLPGDQCYLLKYGPSSQSGCRGKFIESRMRCGNVSASIMILFVSGGSGKYVRLDMLLNANFRVDLKYMSDVENPTTQTLTGLFEAGQFAVLGLRYHTDDKVYPYIVAPDGESINLPWSPSVSTFSQTMWGIIIIGNGKPAIFDWISTNI